MAGLGMFLMIVLFAFVGKLYLNDKEDHNDVI